MRHKTQTYPLLLLELSGFEPNGDTLYMHMYVLYLYMYMHIYMYINNNYNFKS